MHLSPGVKETGADSKYLTWPGIWLCPRRAGQSRLRGGKNRSKGGTSHPVPGTVSGLLLGAGVGSASPTSSRAPAAVTRLVLQNSTPTCALFRPGGPALCCCRLGEFLEKVRGCYMDRRR